jgi:hypothetical protein
MDAPLVVVAAVVEGIRSINQVSRMLMSTTRMTVRIMNMVSPGNIPVGDQAFEPRCRFLFLPYVRTDPECYDSSSTLFDRHVPYVVTRNGIATRVAATRSMILRVFASFDISDP